MNGPRRLRESGGDSERLLRSASIDKPSRASRARAVELAGTAGAFVTTTAGAAAGSAAFAGAKGGGAAALYKSVALWVCIGAIGGGSAALFISEFGTRSTPATPNSASTPLAPPLALPEPLVAAASPEIAAEPAPAESKQIESARAALARGDSNGALQALDSYDAANPHGALQAEAVALRVQALSNSGELAKARALASEFEKKFPTSPLRAVVRDAVKAK